MIDYAAQFKLIDYTTADAVTSEYKNHRVYTDPKRAFMHAARVEGRGIDVALATTGFGQFHVWTVSAIDICSDCGEEHPIADMIDLTREGFDPCKVMVCKDCDVKAHTCERCQEQVDHTRNAIPGDLNSAYWCDACISRFPLDLVFARCLACGYETHDEVELEMWNGYSDHVGSTWTPACTNHSVWVRRDGSVCVVHGEGQFTEISAP